MGDLSAKLQDVIKRVEVAVNKGLGRGEEYNDGALDSKEKENVSVFARSIIQQAVDNNDITADDAKTIFGLELSPQATAARSNAPDDGDNGDGDGDGNTTTIDDPNGGSYTITTKGDGSVTVVINNWNTVVVNLTVNADIQSMVDQIIEAINNKEFNVDFLGEDFINDIMNNLLNVIKGLFIEVRNNQDMNFDNLMEFLEVMFRELNMTIENQADMIAALLDRSFQKIFSKYGESMERLFNYLKNMTENQEANNELLMDLYDAIHNLTDNFNNYTNEQRDQFAKILELLENGSMNLEQIKALLDTIKNDVSKNSETSKQILKAIQEGNTAILDALATINAHFTEDGDITALLKQIATKELSVTIDGSVNINIDAILDKLDEIIGNQGDNKDYLKKILEAINSYGAEITGSLTTIIANMGNDSGKIDKLLAFLEKMDKNNAENTQKLLDAIAALELNVVVDNLKVDIDIQGIIDAITNSTGDINAKMDDITALLNAINNNVVKGNEQNEELIGIANDILAEVKKLGFDVSGGIATLIDAVNGNKEELQKILAFLKNMDESNKESFNNLIDAINNLDLNVVVDNLKVDIDVQGIIDAITGSTGDINAKMDDITALLNAINNNVIHGNEQNAELIGIANDILAQINSLGFNISGGIAQLITAAEGNTAELKKILALLEQMNTNVQNVVTALNNLNIDISGDGRWQEVIDAINNNTIAANRQGNNINSWLEDIYGVITALTNNIGTGSGSGDGGGLSLGDIQAMLNNMITNLVAALNGTLDDNFESLMNMLHQILEAIKNLTVEVVITYNSDTGECDIPNPNEGQNDNLGGLLSRSKNTDDPSGIENITAATNSAKSSEGIKFTIPGKGVFIANKVNGEFVATTLGGVRANVDIPQNVKDKLDSAEKQ